jgi:polysaccharide chain length determinant protein (PEP-CTERM system associated)
LINQPQTIGDYIDIVKRRKWSLILPALIVTVIAVVIALVLTPVYRSSATILIEDQKIPQDFVMTTVTSFAEQRLQSINQRITSSTRLLELINKFDLYRDEREKKTTEEIVAKMRDDVKLNLISADVIDRRTGRPAKATIAFSLSYSGKESPQKILRVADTLTTLFLEENLQIREQQTKDISSFLQEEVKRQKAELEQIEDGIAAFKEAHLNELPEMLQANMQDLNNTERDIERLEGKLQTLREREGYLQIQLASLDPDLDNKETRLKDLKLQQVTLKTRVSENHPDLQKVKAEIEELEKAMAGENGDSANSGKRAENPAYVTLDSQLAGTQSEMEFIKKQLDDLEKEKEKYTQRIETTPNIEQEYTALLMERNSARTKLDDLMRKIAEARVAHSLEKEQKGERFTLIDPARLPEKPFKPNRLLIMVIGVVLGAGAGVGLLFLREFTDQSIRSIDTLAAASSIPVLAGIRTIVTPRERRRKRIQWAITAAASLLLVVGLVVVFHYFIMDLDIFWAKVMRRLAL